jgi:nucleotide-binding universal stress UspA family protein
MMQDWGLGMSNEFEQVPFEAAEKVGADLIVLASHGRRGIAGLLLGSEATKLLTHTKIPAVVVR